MSFEQPSSSLIDGPAGQHIEDRARDEVEGGVDQAQIRSTEAAQERLFEHVEELLARTDFLSEAEHPKTGESMRVVDVGVLKDVFAGLARERSELYREGGGAASLLRHLPELVPNTPALTPEQVVQGDFRPRQIYYQPESPQASVDPVEIKNSRFHALPWELVQQHSLARQNWPPGEGASSECESVSALEAEAALVIFHPDRGNGFRSQRDGRLYIYDREKDAHVHFSVTNLLQHGFNFQQLQYAGEQGTEGPLRRKSARERMRTLFPHLVGAGELIPERDVREITTQTKERNASRVERFGVSSSGSRMFNGVLHYIGKEFYNKEVAIRELAPGVGGVLDMSAGSPVLTHTFTIFSAEEIEPTKSGWRSAGKKDTQVTPIAYEHVIGERDQGESQLEHDAHLETIKRNVTKLYQEVLPHAPEYAQIIQRQPNYELKGITETAYWLEQSENPERLIAFTEQFGWQGLRSFVQLGANERMAEEVLSFAHESPEQAVRVFESYAGLLDRMDTVRDVVRRETGCKGEACEELIEAARERLLRKTVLYLTNALGTQDGHQRDLAEVVQDAYPVAASLAAGIESGALRSVQDMEGFRQDVVSGTRALQDANLMGDMIAIYKANYSQYDDGGAGLVEQFREKLTHEDAKVHLWRIRDEVLAFVLVTDRPEEADLYVSALNVNPALVDAKAGTGLVRELEETYVKQGVALSAEATLDNAAGYCKFGYVATAAHEDADEGHILDVTRYPDRDYPTQSWKLSKILHLLQDEDEYTDPETGVRLVRTRAPTPPGELGRGFVMTNLVRIGKGGERSYIFVLEPEHPTPAHAATAPRT
jgi:predicted N-acetyltransferase YhbS